MYYEISHLVDFFRLIIYNVEICKCDLSALVNLHISTYLSRRPFEAIIKPPHKYTAESTTVQITIIKPSHKCMTELTTVQIAIIKPPHKYTTESTTVQITIIKLPQKQTAESTTIQISIKPFTYPARKLNTSYSNCCRECWEERGREYFIGQFIAVG